MQPHAELITTTILVTLIVLGLLKTQWDLPAVLMFAGMCLAGLGVVLALWIRAWTNMLLRILAALLAAFMILSAIDFVRTQLSSGGSLLGVRTPLVGVVVVGLPALIFAVSGRPRVESFFGPVREREDQP